MAEVKLPPAAIGYADIDMHGARPRVRMVRLSHLVEWLDEVHDTVAAVPEKESARAASHRLARAELAVDIRDTIRQLAE